MKSNKTTRTIILFLVIFISTIILGIILFNIFIFINEPVQHYKISNYTCNDIYNSVVNESCLKSYGFDCFSVESLTFYYNINCV